METKLKEMLTKAEEAGACKKDIAYIRAHYKTLEQALKDPKAAYWAYYYACYVLKASWPKGEEAIKKDTYYAYRYACYVLEAPW